MQTSNPYTRNEEFDSRYQVHRSSEFKWGRIFKVLWTEPKGNGSEITAGVLAGREGPYGQSLKVRRFLIIKEELGFSFMEFLQYVDSRRINDLTKITRSIMTYASQGTNKRGVNAKTHAIIYTENPTAKYGEMERGLTRRPIRVIPSEPQHKLDPASRLNYAKIYTVEHNLRVWFIGKLAPESEELVVTDYNQVNPPLFRPSPNVPVATGSNNYHASNIPSQLAAMVFILREVASIPIATNQFLVVTVPTPLSPLQFTIKSTFKIFQGIVHNSPAQYFGLSSLNN
ncbi:heterokaryon incompatibility protein [Rutstroemia sp. NJR-2017a BBW]|nr:heterokaryon incompatibility protein [Rutstroemia sp. NJR-2017a BBW]